MRIMIKRVAPPNVKESNRNYNMSRQGCHPICLMGELFPDTVPQDWMVFIHGVRIREAQLANTWKRAMKKAVAQGMTPFTFHDLKAKGYSDHQGNAHATAGHRTDMQGTYDRRPHVVKPTK